MYGRLWKESSAAWGHVVWCGVVCGGVEWCAVVCGGVEWCAVVCGGAACCSVAVSYITLRAYAID